jgi:opacity protein-like surface antigen
MLLASPGWAQEEPAQPASTETSGEPPAETPAETAPNSETQEPASEEGQAHPWTVSITPVIWLATTSTDITVGDRSRSLVLTAGDALGDFQSGGTARFEANNGTWGGFADIFFINLEDTNNVGPRGNIPLTIGVDNTVWQVAGTYRVVDKDDFDLDLLAGARGYSIDLDVTVEPFTGPAGVLQFPGRFASRGLSFTDPIIGGKANWQLSEKWAMDFYADIGGFGAGSDFTYRLGAGAGYSVSDNVSLRAGYTLIDFDYSQGTGFDQVEYDTTMSGPTLGATFKF